MGPLLRNGPTDQKGLCDGGRPGWFTALNENVRYQLTGSSRTTTGNGFAPRQSRQAAARATPFVIPPSVPGTKCAGSSGPRAKTPYALKHRWWSRREKPKGLQGRYLNPEEYGKPASMGMNVPRWSP